MKRLVTDLQHSLFKLEIAIQKKKDKVMQDTCMKLKQLESIRYNFMLDKRPSAHVLRPNGRFLMNLKKPVDFPVLPRFVMS